MKKEKKTLPVDNKIKSVPGSDPVNKFKKGGTTSTAAINNTIGSSVKNVKAKSGRGLANEGTNVDYNDER